MSDFIKRESVSKFIDSKVNNAIDQESIGRKLCKSLRHDLSVLSLKNPHFDKAGGWVRMDYLINYLKHVISINNLVELAKNDRKRRYMVKGNINDPSSMWIRAVQGWHKDAPIDRSYLRLLSKDSPEFEKPWIHGCRLNDLVKIVRSGSLQRMMRKHIHMALGLDVVSGKRASSKVIIYINKELALDLGIKFWIAENGVVLSEGPIPKECFLKVVELQEDGSEKEIDIESLL